MKTSLEAVSVFGMHSQQGEMPYPVLRDRAIGRTKRSSNVSNRCGSNWTGFSGIGFWKIGEDTTEIVSIVLEEIAAEQQGLYLTLCCVEG